MSSRKAFRPAGQLWLSRDGENVLNESRIALLEKIEETGSITKAGKAVGISYRTAWITVDHLNGLSDGTLVERTTGGKDGGGTRLTGEGRDLVRMYRIMQEEHARYLEKLREGIGDPDQFLKLARRISLKSSARNQLFGKVEGIRKEGLAAVVTLSLKGKDRIVSRITAGGLEGLGLRKGDEAYALIKANWIALAAAAPREKGGNALAGTVVSCHKDGREAEVALRLKGGNNLVAMVSAPSVKGLVLREGAEAVAIFDPSNVILGVAG